MQDVQVFLIDCVTIRAFVLFILIMAVGIVSGQQPCTHVLHELLVLLGRVLAHCLGVIDIPRDELTSRFQPFVHCF